MNHQAPEVGTYKVINAYNELFNGKPMPVAEAHFMASSSLNYNQERIKIRIRALYNEKSNGPKKQFPIDKLANEELIIIAMHTHIDALDPDKKAYSIDWGIVEPEVDLDNMLDPDDPEITNIANAQLIANEAGQIDDYDDPVYLRSEGFTNFLTMFNKKNERRL
ncbi:hypothetical protein OQY15_18210 [Pedobacter sp. MC2016-15]|jgi:hypothetical protein|uniref:hypothetical protein n=1 Tax=Pedobacter sp. MC2016-15 TaxID=2994473 RepID=UPI0022456E17|nr:hypothetical protein [Pedobacter sp. MC2016-15]MCX2481044.1 hypothetical protein [Pedobacter sp. MC2016-15]